ncbi:MAG: hypothetical protein LCH59_10890 [Proteobacteria bacterium]|nr:hypothetical protein [Pseudomonadota bacterium]
MTLPSNIPVLPILPSEEVIDAGQVALLLGLSKQTVRRYLYQPRFHHLVPPGCFRSSSSNKLLWFRTEVLDWPATKRAVAARREAPVAADAAGGGT